MTVEHTYKQFDTELEAVRARVLEMGGLVEDQVNKAVEALMDQNATLAEEVVASDVRVNALEVESDEACTQIIARRQPTASDLRMIMTIIKTITDLERIGDEAVKIARFTVKSVNNDRIATPRYSEIRYMSDIALKMLRTSLDSFARLDPSSAASVARQDMEVDEEFHLIVRHLITYMMEDPRNISMFIDLMFVVKAIERIGDHAKNISEYVVYMVKGKDVRHTTLEQLEKELS
ncbi:MAG: phosphate transport system regulatory protein PhoU [Hydrogenophilales bacterium CG03_land_8_20_14_0_80_62_28]|nr:phosphate signaling complex protein PhoU [Betaproteobacteria bacterium]OIO77818.1 MAG: phosphate transport system regulatory protein PhoU [Hydrogenophilaceae bacterium CG1_02_62_390]PIV23213.1 MAG: phosphate transport system regulatory protein PhoU [Hydrogenophilales bacterium CG03_land_8_20_14_0_80_62_28]PIW38229.1 MAG: phosphate transport system regulatory protein PhoU [Hydrogenophilales bacterium CG15_BIG_FIL_POST_REV_8_21_14_020_62_31]PIW72533.1 MAG: phosphate transport system regulatory